jgi:hypothetical protein
LHTSEVAFTRLRVWRFGILVFHHRQSPVSVSQLHGTVLLLQRFTASLLPLQAERELGLHLHPWQESVVDMAVTMIQRGIAQIAAPIAVE